MSDNKLQKIEAQPMAQQQHGLSIEQAWQAVTQNDMTPEKLQVMQKLLAMDSERRFNVAFAAFQAAKPTIVATSVIPNRGKYERFEDIMRVIQPLLDKHGFSVSFSMDFKENRILETCHLSHIGGFTRSNSFAVRAGRADTETQADCKAATTAKRNALCNALNIVIRQDCLSDEEDATIEGDPNAFVTDAQADELERRVKMTNSDVAKFLSVTNARSFTEIPANRYAELDDLLRRKERAGK